MLGQSNSSINVKMEGWTGLECDSDSLRSKKLLEWELSLDARDLRSHAWYHGSVSRTTAEQMVAQRDGDFLVRDCSSQPGNYVLTCRSKGQTLHFVINKIILQADTVYENVQYRFEEDGFDTVPDLITYYVGSGKPVTTVSDAKIRTPRNRQYPLSLGRTASTGAGSAATVRRNRRPSRSDSSAGRTGLPPAAAVAATASPLFAGSPSPEYANRVMRPSASMDEPEHTNREDDDTNRKEIEQQQQQEEPLPPPKPSRSVRHNSQAYPPSGSDSGNGSGDSAHSAPGVEPLDQLSAKDTLRRRSSSGVVIKQAKYSATGDGGGAQSALADGRPCAAFATSMPRLPSAFDLENFHTLLLPVAENKPLEMDALRAVHALLVESGSRILANHLTRADLRLTVADLGPEYAGCMCAAGIELATLPHGRQHRADLIERTECLKLLVATSILTCDTDSERAELLNKWIEVAIDAKTALGNLYGFCAIMLGLCTPQVQRLDDTWHILRQKFTDSAFNFEAKLRSTLKSMNESTNPSAPNTTIPHLLPVLLLYERAFDEITDGTRPFRAHSLHSTIDQWETSTADQGLSTWYAHLNGSRHFRRSLPTFRRNAEIVLADSKTDELLLDLFRTEFHLKFLWGSRGATVAAAERHLKFEQILGVMSEKCESTAASDGYS